MSLSLEVEDCKDKAILRLLNGPLSGCEYRISIGTTLVVAQRAEHLTGRNSDAEIPEFPDNAIVIPVEGGINFELIITEGKGNSDCAEKSEDHHEHEQFELHLFSPDPIVSVHRYYESCQAGTLQFSVRPINTPWQAEMFCDQTPVLISQTATKPSMLLTSIVIGILLLVVGASAFVFWMTFSDKKRQSKVEQVVSGSSEPFHIIRGRDRQLYIFANTERDVSWARQALMREALAAPSQISTLRNEELRITNLIQANYPTLDFHRVKLDDPAKPLILLSQERAHINEQMQRALTANLMSWMPYADSISQLSWSDAMLEMKAKSGLDRLGIPYAQVNGENGVNYSIEGNLDDIDLVKLQAFSEKFYRDFGERYVTFSVALKEDWLKGKSFRYGISGYVKMAPQHWYFPQTF